MFIHRNISACGVCMYAKIGLHKAFQHYARKQGISSIVNPSWSARFIP